MTAIDRQQIIEDAARAMHNTAGWWPWERLSTEEPLWAEGWRDNAKAALPVIVAAVLKPIRDLHTPDGHGWCNGCACRPCPTARICDQIEADAKGGE